MMLTGSWHKKAAVDLPGAGPEGAVGVRAALVPADALTRALGRPNREQVVTSRPKVATTLDALELTNGTTMSRMLRDGAGRWAKKHATNPTQLIVELYQNALGRQPTPEESTAAATLVGSPPTPEGVEDLLWILTMLPEFQLIH
jgi:hypothetical protein